MANHKIEATDGVVAVDPSSSPPQKIIIDTDPGIGINGRLQAIMNGNAKKLAEQDESVIRNSGIPYTIIRTGSLTNTPGGKQGTHADFKKAKDKVMQIFSVP